MKSWRDLDELDFVCSKCEALPGDICRSSKGYRVKEFHGARRDKLRHEKYVQGLLERST